MLVDYVVVARFDNTLDGYMSSAHAKTPRYQDDEAPCVTGVVVGRGLQVVEFDVILGRNAKKQSAGVDLDACVTKLQS